MNDKRTHELLGFLWFLCAMIYTLIFCMSHDFNNAIIAFFAIIMANIHDLKVGFLKIEV